MRLGWIRAVLLAGVVAAGMPAAAAQEVLSVPTRPGITVRVLLVAPAAEPSAMLLMFPGGFGNNHFPERDGRVVLSGNFLVRTARRSISPARVGARCRPRSSPPH